MTKQQLKTIYEDFNYGNITSKFIETPMIKRIQLANDSSINSERDFVDKYYLDMTHGLLYKTTFDGDQELGISAIINVREIVSLETLNAYSVVPFTGAY